MVNKNTFPASCKILLSLLEKPVNIFVCNAPETTINGTKARIISVTDQPNANAKITPTPKFAIFIKKNPKRTPVAYLLLQIKNLYFPFI